MAGTKFGKWEVFNFLARAEIGILSPHNILHFRKGSSFWKPSRKPHLARIESLDCSDSVCVCVCVCVCLIVTSTAVQKEKNMIWIKTIQISPYR